MLQDDDMPVDDAPADEGDGAPRQSYNFAPGYHGVVYRADVPDHGAGGDRSHITTTPRSQYRNVPASQSTKQESQEPDPSSSVTDTGADPAPSQDQAKEKETHYKLQSMKWGLVPFWTKRSPDYASTLKTINCRDDSLAQPGGMWASMKARKRCVVLAQGFYEWLNKSGNKVPHYVKRRDGRLMCFAGLWDCVRYDQSDKREGEGGGGEAEGLYTYTIITTSSNERLKFLHDRMPVILEAGSEAMWRWLDPGRYEWSRELQEVLKPFEGELEVYPVSKEVGKVGNNSPSFVIPVASRENKANIANFFAKGGQGKKGKSEGEVEVKKEDVKGDIKTEMKTVEELEKTADDGGMGLPKKGVKREADVELVKGEPPAKKTAPFKAASPVKGKQQGKSKISAVSNASRSPVKAKGKADGSQKITKFFGNSV